MPHFTDITKRLHTAHHSLMVGMLVGAFWFANISHAGNVYMFKDKNGNVLLTNVVNKYKKPKGQFKKYQKKVKVTWYKDTNVHKYTNWGKSERAVLPKYNKNKGRYDALILTAANRHGVDAALMKAIMHTESGFNPRARSPVGAQGLMQLMPATARRFGVRNVWNPSQNIEGSAKYLKYLTKRFRGNKNLMLAGYNAGEGNVDKYNGIPPFRETQNYVKKVMSRYHKLYKNKSFISTSTGNGSVITASELSRQPSNKITKTTKNGTHYIKTSLVKSKNHFSNADLTRKYGVANYTSVKSSKRTSNKNPRFVSNQSTTSYDASAFAALNKQ